jgi:hypothetical protein
MKTLLAALALFAPFHIACDAGDDPDTEVEDQAQAADVLLEDALTTVDDASETAVIVDSVFELGVDDGFYSVETIDETDALVVYEVDARTGERVELERRAAERDRADLARRQRTDRRRLAQLVREVRLERRRARAIRARLAGDEAEIELVDRDGRREVVRRRLARG